MATMLPSTIVLPVKSILPLAIGTLLIYLAGLVVYRLYFHPLSKFPGPKIAAISSYVELYYDGFLKGQYSFVIERMHKKYGPIVRTSPSEIHINDPDFIDQVFPASHKKSEKPWRYAVQIGSPLSVAATVNHDHHRLRRAALNPLFAKSAIRKLEPVLVEKVDKLCRRLGEYAEAGKIASISNGFSCMTSDIISEYTVGSCYNLLDSETFLPNFQSTVHAALYTGIYVKRYPWLFTLMRALPDSLVKNMMPQMALYLDFQNDVQAITRRVLAEREAGIQKKLPHATIYETLLDNNLPAEEKTYGRLWQEVMFLIGAGTETTAWALSVIAYFVLSTQGVAQRLREELFTAIPDATKLPSLDTIEQLSYLSAVVHEGLRLAQPVVGRLPRLLPHETIKFREWTISPGTEVTMSIMDANMNPKVFPNPREFRPERWMEDKSLEKHTFTFGRGSRNCAGLNLAWAELFLATAAVFRRLDMDLYETTREDVDLKHDFLVLLPKADTKGIRVTFK